MLTKQLIHALGDDPQNHELSTTTKIGSKVFPEGTYLQDVLSEIGCETSFDFLVHEYKDGQLDIMEIHDCKDERFYLIDDGDKTVIWHVGSIYWDISDTNGLLAGGCYRPMEYHELFSHCETQRELEHVINAKPENYSIPESLPSFSPSKFKTVKYYHWCQICYSEYSCPIPNPHVYACDSCSDEGDSEK